MTINKAHWVTEGDNVRFSMPIGKVDQERRIVSGFATLDNIDKQNDIVTTEASLKAFAKFRGNIREMHSPLAVGKMVSFKEDRYFDPNTKKFYNGVYVSAYVSKGAQDTWEKCLDGTLTGFSIGGNITKTEDTYNAELDKAVRIIKEYDLFELSLVDNPANQFANVISIEKVDGQNVASGYLSKASIDNVYWCKSDDIVRLSENSEESCPSCSKSMQNIGFVEKNDDNETETLKFLVDNAKGIRTIKMTKEVNPMTEDTIAPVEDITEETTAEETSTEETVAVEKSVEDAPAEEAVEKSTTVDIVDAGIAPETQTEGESTVDESAQATEEVVGKTPKNESDAQAEHTVVDVKKSDEATAEAVSEIKESLTNAFGDLTATIKSISDQVAELTKSLADVTGNVANVTNNVAAVANEVTSVKNSFNEFGKRVDQVEADTAFRKSGDLGEIVQFEPSMTQKSLWGGRFLKNSDLFN
jgi:archaellum component FlaC